MLFLFVVSFCLFFFGLRFCFGSCFCLLSNWCRFSSLYGFWGVNTVVAWSFFFFRRSLCVDQSQHVDGHDDGHDAAHEQLGEKFVALTRKSLACVCGSCFLCYIHCILLSSLFYYHFNWLIYFLFNLFQAQFYVLFSDAKVAPISGTGTTRFGRTC